MRKKNENLGFFICKKKIAGKKFGFFKLKTL